MENAFNPLKDKAAKEYMIKENAEMQLSYNIMSR